MYIVGRLLVYNSEFIINVTFIDKLTEPAGCKL